MAPESENNNSQMKLIVAFALGLGVAGAGAWLLSGDRQIAPAEPRIAVSAPAVETQQQPMPALEAPQPEPVRVPALEKRGGWKRKTSVAPAAPARPAPVTIAKTDPAPAPPAAPAVVDRPAPSQPQAPALPEIVRREQPRLENVAPPPPPAPVAASVTIKAGTMINVRLAERISTEIHKNGDTFSATLAQPLVVDGFVIAERNARVQGRVVQAERPGKVRGIAMLSLEITQFTASDGQRVAINTAPVLKEGENSRKDDAKKVAIGSAVGAAIGAIAGGGKGAAVGAGAGAGAGAGTVAMTRGKELELDVETRLSFSLSNSVTLTEKLSN